MYYYNAHTAVEPSVDYRKTIRFPSYYTRSIPKAITASHFMFPYVSNNGISE